MRLRHVGTKITDLVVLVVFLACAGRRRRLELYADAEQIAKELHRRFAPQVAAPGFWRTEPDPATKQRILEQILATPRTRENGFPTWPRRWCRWMFTILAAVAAVSVLAAGASTCGSGPGPSNASRADQSSPELTLPGPRATPLGPTDTLPVIPLIAAAAMVFGLRQVTLVAVVLIGVSAVAGQTLYRRSQARHVARRQTSPVVPALADQRRPR